MPDPDGPDPGGDGRLRVELPAQHPVTGAPVEGVALVTIDRPNVRNALDSPTVAELIEALERLDEEEACRAIVVTGAGDRAFAAGFDIGELATATPSELAASPAFAGWERISRVRKPLIAAVRGYALGGGCELALACDLIVAGDDAVFGQPEIRLGIMPGLGGTQRLARAMGKALAMDLVLTGRRLGAHEAALHGLVARVVPAGDTVAEALALGAELAALPPLAVAATIEAVDQAFELPLAAGLQQERRAFYALFESADQREGARAFLEKRPPAWTGR